MFQDLTRRLEQTMRKLAGQQTLTEDTVKEALREVRMALLEADVNYQVAKNLVDAIREKVVGQDVLSGLSPAQQVIRIVNQELVRILGGEASELNLPAKAQGHGHGDGHGPAGLGQDHLLRQAREEAAGRGAQAAAGGGGHLPPGRHRPARDDRQAGGRAGAQPTA